MQKKRAKPSDLGESLLEAMETLDDRTGFEALDDAIQFVREHVLASWDDASIEVRSAALEVIFGSQLALKAQHKGLPKTSRHYVERCRFLHGYLAGMRGMSSELDKLEAETRASFARLGADAAHRENRQMQAVALAWWEANKHTGISKNAAAEAIAGKVVPLKFITVRNYLKNA